MLIAQISDMHLTEPGSRVMGRVDTHGALIRALAAIERLSPRPDLVIGTGDLTETGSAVQYAALSDALARLSCPFLPVAGNHDTTDALRTAFGLPEDGPHFQYAWAGRDLTVLVLDTTSTGSGDASYCAERAAWLEEQLGLAAGPVVVAMHHPPFPIGVTWIDPPDVEWAAQIARLVRASGKVRKLICGHIHRSVHRVWAGVSVATAPSIAHQVALDLTAGAPAMLSHEAPGFCLHRWDGEEFTSYVVSIPGFDDRFDRHGLPVGEGRR